MWRRRWACPPEEGAAATPNSTLLHSETLCPELVKDEAFTGAHSDCGVVHRDILLRRIFYKIFQYQ